MAENIQTDSDSQGPIQPGVGKTDQTNRAIHQINPNWVEDGYGIVGPQRPVIQPQSATPTPMPFGVSKPQSLNPDQIPCAPTTPPDTGTWIWGAIDGECQWIDTTDCS